MTPVIARIRPRVEGPSHPYDPLPVARPVAPEPRISPWRWVLGTAIVVALLALAGCATPHIDSSPVGQFGIVRPPPLSCSETSGPPWNAAKWVLIWDGDRGFGYCKVPAKAPHRVDCMFDHCERTRHGWRCGARGAR